jgi:menaquinol-cytochrome c reductase cytochrome b/c subunit
MTVSSRFDLQTDDDARRAPVRLVVVQGDRRPAVEVEDEVTVMTVPHLLVREAIAFVALSLVLATLALLFDAPLEEIANPEKTPNPAKAPWYFLGLQELLHYYPPIVSGVVLPGLVLLALIVVPYFDVNLTREALWRGHTARKLGWLWSLVAALSLVFLTTAAHPVWPVMIPMWIVAAAMTVPAVWRRDDGFVGWLGDRSLAFWVFLWFLLAAAALTVVGVAFRGPGWQLTLPWRDGLY